ncbi:invasion associated locus B family protein [Roseibium sp. RKSG952]|uniref:invasion associated locus B family protein n=1 Tax=Roseibium sp. RKSG952 TaxID=2529384 RepID=UPI0012BCBF84|nr:invasion associated locus B family protein [Roseibium sp. RKSG952]MTH99811.1 invasion associated locus B family protein [Roseibium sp. RKSG952]
MPLRKFAVLLSTVVPILALVPAAEAQQAGNETNYWQTRCSGPSRAPQTLTCETTQRVLTAESRQLVFKIDIVYPPRNAAPVMRIQAPLGFHLPGKIKLAVDGTPYRELDIASCDSRGCFLTITADNQLIDAMKAGTVLQLDFAPAPERRQTIDVPLQGFTRAINAIQ